MRRDNEADGWCILTTAGMRTLPLARALAEAGLGAWTPTRGERRTGRGKKRKDVVVVDLPITPTFVFVPAAHLAEVLRVRALPVSPFPPFRVLRHRDRIPVISDPSLGALRAAEERFRVSLLKSTKRRVAIGAEVRMHDGAFAGLTGIVEAASDKDARVNFGGGFTVTIASYLLGTDVVHAAASPDPGPAA